MDYFPIFCQLNNKPCLLVGGGEVAERKARLLMDAGAVISVVAPTFTPQFMQWQNEQRLQCFTAEFSVADLADKWLVIAATDNEQVNQLVYQQATEQRIFCNVVDSPKQASFIMPSVIDRSPIMVAISSGGKAPVLARILREKMEQWLPNSLGALAQLAGKLREQVKQRFATMSARRYFWERFFADKALQAEIDAGRDNGIQQRISTLLAENNQPQGSVVLVGAGPGDAGLMTIKGLQQCHQQGYTHNGSGYSGMVYANYKGKYANIGSGYNYSNDWHEFNYSLNGGVVAHAGGITLTQPLGDTNILIKANDANNIKVENANGILTDNNGYAVLPFASTYKNNRVSLDVNSLEENIELENTIINVVPTKGALVEANFKTNIGYRAMVTLSKKDGAIIPFGAMVVDEERSVSGIVGDNGNVFISGLAPVGRLKAKWGKMADQQCIFDYQINEKSSKEKGIYFISSTCQY